MLFAAFGARVRQPLAGQMLLSRHLLATLDVDALPDDYGIDVALTMHALDHGLPVAQVVTPFPEHEGGANSHRIMADVAGTLLRRLAGGSLPVRSDVQWPERYWEPLLAPPPSSRSLEGLIERVAPPGAAGQWRDLLGCPPEVMCDLWCANLSAAVGRARAGESLPEVVGELSYPFLVHAEYRRRLEVDRASAETYITELSDRLAAALR